MTAFRNHGKPFGMMLVAGSTNTLLSGAHFSESFERLRLTARINTPEWLDLLNMSWHDYQQLKINKLTVPYKSTEKLAEYFGLKLSDIRLGLIDYKALAIKIENQSKAMPERYSQAAFGRKRTSITSIDFIERYGGWRLRLDTLQKLSVSETLMQDSFAPISMRFITDLCAYLARRQFKKSDFFAMGAFTYEGNKNSVVEKLFSEMPNAKEAYEFFFNDCMKLFEQNCNYKITRLSENDLSVEYVTNPDVAAESGVRHLGSKHVCQVKMGLIANIPRYLGLPAASINEISCVHCGDHVCRLDVDFSSANQAQLKPLFLNH